VATHHEAVRVHHLEIPLVAPFATASGVVMSRSIALVRVGSSAPYGWGEAAPYPGQDEAFGKMLDIVRQGGTTPAFAAALTMAIADRDARLDEAWLGDSIGATAGLLTVGLAVGFDSPVAAVVKAVERGVGRFKLKIAPGNLEYVTEVRRRFPEVVIGVDANGSFGSATVGQLEALSGLGLAYVEQPVRDMYSEACRVARRAVDTVVFADESLRSLDDARRLLECSSVDGLTIKVGRLGWAESVAVRDLVRVSGKMWRVSGLIETEIGRAFTNILAACTDPFVSDVAPADWFMRSGVAEIRDEDGFVTVGGPGIGVVPDPDRLALLEVARFEVTHCSA